MASTGNALEEWHRYVVPGLLDRIQKRVKQHCDEVHQPWPARARFARQQTARQIQARFSAFEGDLTAETADEEAPGGPKLKIVDEDGRLVDPQTGEVT